MSQSVDVKRQEIREAVTFKNQGEKLFGIIHRPIDQENVPGVILCHGFAGSKVGRFRAYVLLAELLAKHGIAALRFDFRGSGDSEGDWDEMSIEGEVSDALAALNFLENDPQVNPQRIGLFGRSLGGAIGVIAARRYQRIKSLAFWAPVFSGNEWEEHWAEALKKGITKEEQEQMMMFEGHRMNEQFLREFFAMRLDEELQEMEHLPFLHVHGELDQVISLQHADGYSKTRQSASGKTDLLRLPNTNHDFSDPKERALALEKTANWFSETL